MTAQDRLKKLGWNDYFEQQLKATHHSEAAAALPARVISEQREHYRLQFGDGNVVWGEITGKIRHGAESRLDYPAVGDWVLASMTPSKERAVIQNILKRKTCLARRAAGEKEEAQIFATNIDTVFVLTSLNQELNLRRMERYLVMIAESGATPVILLTKSDLVAHSEDSIESMKSVSGQTEVLAVSPKTGKGLELLSKYIGVGQTSVLVGSSGVGKSTLINRLAGHEFLKTQEVRNEDDKGRHTTTARELVQLPDGGMIIDTPGIRELQLMDSDGLQDAFSDIESVALQCKFTNCLHESEPGCRVKQALESGQITATRWESYQKLQREMLAAKRRTDKAHAAQEKTRMRAEQKVFKRHGKRKPR